jgi:hypothetical protein
VKTYTATRRAQGRQIVTVKAGDGAIGPGPTITLGYRLPERQELWNHSPAGFEWGYAGSGPSQLALALLADHFGVKPGQTRTPEGDRAIHLHQRFKERIVAILPHDGWTLTSAGIESAVCQYLHKVVCDMGGDRFTCRNPECKEATCRWEPYMDMQAWALCKAAFFAKHPPTDPDVAKNKEGS